MHKSVFFDLDDTLVHKTSIIDAKRDIAKEVAKKLQIPLDHVTLTMDSVDKLSVSQFGFGDKTRLASSMREGVEKVSALSEIAPDELKNILAVLSDKAYIAGLKAIEKKSKLMPGALEAVADIRDKGYKTFVVTKGSYDVQNKAITDNKLDKLLDGVFVLNHKTMQEMYQVLMVTNSISRQSWFIGNSPKSDVNPAYRAGMSAIYIPHPTTWSLELEDLIPGIITVDNLSQITEHIP